MRPASRLLARRVARWGPAPPNVFRNYGFVPEKAPPKQTDLSFTVRAVGDHAAIFEGRSTPDLLRALLVLRLCAVGPFVTHSEALLDTARRALGDGPTMAALRSTFYSHFVAGRESADVWARMNALRAHGIGAILDWAEEEDLLKHCVPNASDAAEQPAAAAASPAASLASTGGTVGGKKQGKTVSSRTPLGGESVIQSRVAARTHEYEDEAACERHAAAFLAAIDTAAHLPGQGFAAVKLSALTDPELLEHLSTCLTSVQGLFRTYDLDGDGYVDKAEFDECYERITRMQGGATSEDERSAVWRWLDKAGEGRVDYVAWCARLQLRHLPDLAAGLERQASVFASVDSGTHGAFVSRERPWDLTPQEHVKLDALFARLERLVERAVSKGVKLMIDAEQSVLRPAIDHLGHELMRKHNRVADAQHAGGSGNAPGEAVIFATYQAYLRDAPQRLADDLARAERQGYVLGAKLVRGAYLHLERRRAAESRSPSPVWDHIEETHASYEKCQASLLSAVKAGRAELMVGSHNQASVEGCVAAMAAEGLDPETAPVYFGQLLGMADHLSFTLGQHGYKVFKYCPYGSVEKVIPYLLRRVNENQYVLQGGKQDVQLLAAELWRRLLHDPQHSPLARLLGRGSDGATSSTA
ncbi:hypothetical protein GPECTOR_3g490 [Gonium pectorale]|uniref:Proline dehydrogenase n=1 Tax=Gonium pectorale TaxID=33097 RepID=A0A150GZT5_GONPE|nr:hypothetical protein GPECTOR_3g490 [Gonium pectorale]|eukprot:KXZ55361.1 hypothetical protein GPECTOR_3g490 [Gonium pectorale]